MICFENLSLVVSESNDINLGIGRDERHGLEAVHVIDVQLLDGRRQHVRAEVADRDGVAIWSGLLHAVVRDRAAGTRHVLGHDGAAERARHALGHDPRERVGGPPGRERHDERDRTAWILGVRDGRGGGNQERGDA